jgi:hypothetical protein
LTRGARSACCCRFCHGYTFGLLHKILLFILVAVILYFLIGTFLPANRR